VELIDRLAHNVAKKLRAFAFSSPTRPVLGLLIRTAYLASLKTEEGRFVQGSITFAEPDEPDLDPPLTRRADYPSFTRFARPMPLTVEGLVKLARAIDKWSGSIVVYGTAKSILVAWGVLDQLVKNNVRLNREGVTGFGNPGIVTINMDGVGDLSIYHDSVFLGGLSGHQLVVRENDALQSRMLAARVMPALFPAAAGIASALGSPGDLESQVAQLFDGWTNTIARLCIGLRRLGTGGSLLITPVPVLSKLDIGYRFNYRRLGDSMILQALDNQYSAVTNQEARDDRYSGQIPQELVIEMGLAEADASDRESEVTGAVKVVTSLAAADGLVLLTPKLHVVGFGVKIGPGPAVNTVYDGADFARMRSKAKKINPARFGTRHTSMLRYCRSDRAAVGIVVSQDGHVRLMMSSGRSVTLWDNVKLLRHLDYSNAAVRSERAWRRDRRQSHDRVTLGYTSMPKTLARLLAPKNK
jgi:hypothetical protein